MNYNTVLSYKKENMKIKHFYQNIGEDWFTYPNLYKSMVYKYYQGGHFVEVGSWKGRSASFMAVEIYNSGHKDDIKFDCVDTWKGSIEHQDLDEIKNDSLYRIFLQNVEPVLDLINPIRKSSIEASKQYDDNSLDFVFLDASHEYNDIIDDINAWLPKLKIGGTLAGHDYGRHNVNKAVNDYFKNKEFSVSEDCWIYEKSKNSMVSFVNDKKITLVTGLWNIGRSELSNQWSRDFDHYLEKFKELLLTPINMIIYGDEDLEKFVWGLRDSNNTQFIKKGVKEFSENNEFYEKIQKIRSNENWLSRSSWLRDSTQAKLEMYNPLVMNKMFLLNDARILEKFDSDYLFWIDAGITNTVHHGYFTQQLFDKIPKYIDKFSFVCFPYQPINEIHGNEYTGLCNYAGNKKVDKVARGGFFGGPKNSFHDVNGLYYHMLKDTLNDGYMGTEESIFTILMYRYCDKFNHFEIEENGLLYKFFEDLGEDKLIVKTQCEEPNQNFSLNTLNTALYVITFNSPLQIDKLVQSMLMYDENFVKKPKKFLLNNSTDKKTDKKYKELCKKYDFVEIKKDNIGICGGRQLIAEHAEENGFDFYFFFEDDMFFYPQKGHVCKNGFSRFVNNLYESSLQIIKDNGFDFLKLSYTEFFGNNGTQWSWYNVPQDVREKFWPEYCKLPQHGTDPNSPKTIFKNINCFNNIPFVNGEIYYSNWPQVVSRVGNKKMFLDTKWNHPFEQTWMSYMYQLTKNKELNPGLLLLSPTEHNRFDNYDSKLRKEN